MFSFFDSELSHEQIKEGTCRDMQMFVLLL